eukprot:GCRY01002455.1.p1 GENE.GCRY01002455.1~~GCRY01002455.1.p1  ORF type:complete len:654 (-),score=178.07 GCRY01002455.1:336-2297(-)
MLQVQNSSGVKIYNVSAGKNLPEWQKEAKKRSLRYDQDFRRRIELLQEFDFPAAGNRVKASPNGIYFGASGVYQPRIKIFDLNELTLKFERHLETEIVQFQFLADDWTKLAFLGADRTVEVHSQYGRHHRTRIPKFGRDMSYHAASCDLYLCGVSNDIWRLNLDQGTFLSPLQSAMDAINVCKLCPVHDLLACGGESGVVECWDPRDRSCVGQMSVSPAVKAAMAGVEELDLSTFEVTALRFDSPGLELAVGTSTGHVLLYDLRMQAPLAIKDHNNGLPIVDVKYHSYNNNQTVFSADSNGLKAWDRTTTNTIVAIEPESTINDVCIFPNSGLVMLAVDSPKQSVYYVPALGPAPRWAASLDSLTEELEEEREVKVYDDYTFVTRDELNQLGLNHLIGTHMLRPHLHGFYINSKLHQKAKLVSNPFAYADYKRSRALEKLRQEQDERIQVKRKLPKVNPSLAKKLMAEEKKKKKKAADGEEPSSLISDERFQSLFTSEDFTIDTANETYALLNPSSAAQARLNNPAPPPPAPTAAAVPGVFESAHSEPHNARDRKGPAVYELKSGEDIMFDKATGRVKSSSRKSSSKALGARAKKIRSTAEVQAPVGGFEVSYQQKARPQRMSERKRAELEHFQEVVSRERRSASDLGRGRGR